MHRRKSPLGGKNSCAGVQRPYISHASFRRGKSGVPRKCVFRPPLSSWVGAAAMARFGVNTFGRVGARMARLELGVTAIKGARALNARVPARTVPVPIPEGDADSKDHFI